MTGRGSAAGSDPPSLPMPIIPLNQRMQVSQWLLCFYTLVL